MGAEVDHAKTASEIAAAEKSDPTHKDAAKLLYECPFNGLTNGHAKPVIRATSKGRYDKTMA
jgi:hypothetical protein